MNTRRFLAPALLAGLVAAPAHSAPTPTDLGPRADRLLVVDCLLPGQVRRLGQNMTYLSARRPAKISAEDCELRGGEYVAYDRASMASALAMWLPLAQQGDKEAQTYVGEIYEKGTAGAVPDYATAAQWYRKAADQGYSRARINLGFLYEKGLGVKKDPATALNFYRQASGLEGLISLDEGTAAASAAREEEFKALRRELDQTKQALERAKQELQRQKGASQSELQRLQQQKQQAADAGNIAAVRKLEAQLQRREEELEGQRSTVAKLEKSVAAYREQLAGAASESASLRNELEQVRRDFALSSSELEQRRQKAAEDQRKLEAIRADLARQREQANANAEGEARIRKLEAQLQAREDDLARQSREIARAEQEAQRYKEQAAKLETQARSAPAQQEAQVAIAPPSIQLIDPPAMRNAAAVQVRGNLSARDVVGKVSAPAGLLSFTVNDHDQSLDKNGLFKTRVALLKGTTPVTMVAVDKQGKRALLEFSLVPEGAVIAPSAAPAKTALPDLDFGTYYALVIGNQKYQRLPSLDTAADDAKAVAELLSSKYGFKVTTLVNATRYQILSELNKLRAKLTEKDNFLIYYAGHGELDRANLRGHWLPVDAEPDSDANWISSVALTDILNAMSVRHALIVADSCYSGAMTRSSIGQLDSGVSEEARLSWLKALVKARSRTVLTSGGVQPVLDGGGGKHSVFAKSFLEVLQNNGDTLEGARLYREVAARVLQAASRLRVEQEPEYAPLKFAGHESGDFLFVPQGSWKQAAVR